MTRSGNGPPPIKRWQILPGQVERGTARILFQDTSSLPARPRAFFFGLLLCLFRARAFFFALVWIFGVGHGRGFDLRIDTYMGSRQCRLKESSCMHGLNERNAMGACTSLGAFASTSGEGRSTHTRRLLGPERT
jgi:hypothetical protein